MTSDRLNNILARQESASEEKRKREERYAADQAEAAVRKNKVSLLWREQKSILLLVIDEINSLMKKNGVQLSHHTPTKSVIDTESMVIYFSDDDHHTRDMKRLAISVSDNGRIYINMGTRSLVPAKEFNFDIDDTSKEIWENTIIDFLDINTP